jgi:hypothetical protein
MVEIHIHTLFGFSNYRFLPEVLDPEVPKLKVACFIVLDAGAFALLDIRTEEQVPYVGRGGGV